uniref:Cell division cycle protein 123 n=1 Tax=Aplanochytrium stocchinoi TaxID=215587 RepID=A0A7S3PQZ1_9STRA|mmetsp:Transcript_7213/g.8684  ORF Transcript_7213/g.8684 Transcript_7213/m.8684 type:complete len:377 (+) Transcript_7213:378-1508(+)|eukprot:CAMPEP_0204835316 /NCGR_PEP_ID=MMETSP1346-20131115/22235_1 /ASSEMBLY_ACC=CAM_ASM_000771 /TAXON_ID=215587 /ORGANISM="Aplanochytrium stocchinoi, Strain GSBS06" /LENGTH=376 /DNA_ID=CAMNT_0051969207 /DNA_START=365 /DNA_END=1495 /DNA_ORIENTATION=-
MENRDDYNDSSSPFPPKSIFGKLDFSQAKIRLNKVASEKQSIRDKPRHKELLGNEEENDRLRDYTFQAGLDEWYDKLKHNTFESEFVPIKAEEAKAIVSHWYKRGNISDYIGDMPKSLLPLTERIEQAITKNSWSDRGAFIKLSTRSPKDSETLLSKAKSRYKTRINTLRKQPSEREKKILYCEELVAAAAVHSGHEAISILLDSWRVIQDLESAFEEDGKPVYPLSVVVRKWDTRVTPQTEFRAFIWGGKLTCIGQYWHFLHLPELKDIKHEIAEDCCRFYEDHLKESMPVPNAMLDLAWLGPGQVLLIEINPLQEGMGDVAVSTGLFDFENKKDKAVLTGKAPFEIRLRIEDEGGEKGYSKMGYELKKMIDQAE